NININEKSIPQQIKEYKELLDIDAITKEEFEMKKKELLNK
ncbi:MAG: SHOCT domain-containing protein, partial [Paeniclostridium sordellii]|nr:SHOCT domain-containing protein [Paeniclostridium sordellii]